RCEATFTVFSAFMKAATRGNEQTRNSRYGNSRVQKRPEVPAFFTDEIPTKALVAPADGLYHAFSGIKGQEQVIKDTEPCPSIKACVVKIRSSGPATC